MIEYFIDFPLSHHNSVFSIDLAGNSDCSDGYTVYREKAKETAVIYILQGEGTVYLDQAKYTAQAGDTLVIPAGRKHYYYSNDKNPWKIIWYNIVGPLGLALVEAYDPYTRVVFPNFDSRAHIAQVHALASRSELSAPEKHQQAALLFHELLQVLHATYYTCPANSPSSVKTVRNYLDNHFREPIRLEQLSSLVYMSQSQLIRNFRQATGYTPYEYCLTLKLRQAKKLLAGTNMRVRDISASLGFCDEHYFSSLFKKKTGETPQQYRKQLIPPSELSHTTPDK